MNWPINLKYLLLYFSGSGRSGSGRCAWSARCIWISNFVKADELWNSYCTSIKVLLIRKDGIISSCIIVFNHRKYSTSGLCNRSDLRLSVLYSDETQGWSVGERILQVTPSSQETTSEKRCSQQRAFQKGQKYTARKGKGASFFVLGWKWLQRWLHRRNDGSLNQQNTAHVCYSSARLETTRN